MHLGNGDGKDLDPSVVGEAVNHAVTDPCSFAIRQTFRRPKRQC